MVRMMSKTSSVTLTLAATSLLLCGPAHAHFKLLKPTSWVKEANDGAPQKGTPCGPGGFDDVQPVPMSMEVTTVEAGSTITVELEETVHHPGWFRIALDEDRSKFKDPTFPNSNNCAVDLKTVPTMPHDNVLADGLEMNSDITGANRKITQMIKIPDKPCDKCTLQVIQVMADQLHAPPGCIYYHCADLKIVAKGSSAAGAGAAGAGGAAGGASGGAGAAAGTGAAGGASAAGSSATGGSKAATSAGGAGGSSASAGASAPVPGSAGKPAAVGGTTATPSTTGSTTSASSGTAGSSTTPASPPSSGSSGGCQTASGSAVGSFGPLVIGLLAFGLRRRRRLAR